MSDEDLVNLFEMLMAANDADRICIVPAFECQARELRQVVREALLWRLAEAG